MLFLICAGTVAFIFGILLLFLPQRLRKLEAVTNKVLVTTEEKIYNLKIGVGISLLLASALCLFVSYYLFKTHG
ncbi:MAG: hypothetical protein WCI77_08495 [Candidatus Omnitrophota bacterium]